MLLQVKGVTSGYSRELPILNEVNLSAEAQRVTLIIGPNGAGKSTLLKTIYGYLPLLAGEILCDGRSLVRCKPEDMLRHGVAYLLQTQSVFPSMTVEENLSLGAWILRKNAATVRQGLEKAYDRYPWLHKRRRTPAGFLSGGEQRILEIARLTLTQPRLLLLDEPSVGLMPKLVDEVYAEIAKLKDGNLTILIVDQNIKKALEVSDYVYTMQLGRNTHHGPKKEFEDRLPDIIKEWL